MTNKEFLQGTNLITMITGKEWKIEQINIYYKLCCDIEINDFMKGLERMFKERVYTNLPSPAEIREYCLGTKTSKHILASDKLRKAITSFGGYSTIVFDDPILHVVIEKRFQSWIKFCNLTTDELNNFLNFEFEECYKAYSAQKHTDIKTVLLGRHDAKNEGAEGWELGMYTRYIGDAEKAKQWVLQYEEKVVKNQVTNNIKELGVN